MLEIFAAAYQKPSDMLRLEHTPPAAVRNRHQHEFFNPDINVHIDSP